MSTHALAALTFVLLVLGLLALGRHEARHRDPSDHQ
jgi:hypothetical protein